MDMGSLTKVGFVVIVGGGVLVLGRVILLRAAAL